jgi:hypothetical protein
MAKRFIICLSALAGLAACQPSKPGTPTFSDDVQPILVAHCTRCHGAGGMLNADPKTTVQLYTGKPLQGYFTNFADQGDCTQVDGGGIPAAPTCQRGVHFYVTVNFTVWDGYVPSMMPPAPAAPLNDWEIDVLKRWEKNPICGSGPLCSGGDGSVD